jgi:hypothetical protein
MEDATRSYQQVANKFGVTKRSVEQQAKQANDDKGNPTTWAALRQTLGAQANSQHEDQLVANKAQRDLDHTNMYKELQDLAMKKIRRMAEGEPVMVRDKQSGELVAFKGQDGTPMLVYPDGVEIEKTAKALQIAINGERVILGLPTTVNALTGKNGEPLSNGWADMLAMAQKVAADAEADAPAS